MSTIMEDATTARVVARPTPSAPPLRHESVVARDEGDQHPEDRGLDQPV